MERCPSTQSSMKPLLPMMKSSVTSATTITFPSVTVCPWIGWVRWTVAADAQPLNKQTPMKAGMRILFPPGAQVSEGGRFGVRRRAMGFFRIAFHSGIRWVLWPGTLVWIDDGALSPWNPRLSARGLLDAGGLQGLGLLL